MRTTVRLDEGLLKDAKALAARNSTTLTALIEDALRERVARARQQEPRPPVDLPVSRLGGGLMPGVDLDDSAELLDLLEEGLPPDKRR